MMERAGRNHCETLGKHGACVVTAGGKEPVCGAFYDRIIRFCEKYRINCMTYEMEIPETDQRMGLAIWRNGHVDSGSAEHIDEIIRQY